MHLIHENYKSFFVWSLWMTVRILCFTNEYRETLPHAFLGAYVPALTHAHVHSCIDNPARTRRQVRAYTNIFVSLRFPRYPLRIYLFFQATRTISLHDVRILDVYSFTLSAIFSIVSTTVSHSIMTIARAIAMFEDRAAFKYIRLWILCKAHRLELMIRGTNGGLDFKFPIIYTVYNKESGNNDIKIFSDILIFNTLHLQLLIF